jgi:hypothetical protein
MSVVVKNDGKGKHHSFTATFSISGNAGRSGWQVVDITGYGGDEAEARAELAHQMRDLMDTLNLVVKNVDGQSPNRTES